MTTTQNDENVMQIIACPFCEWSMARTGARRVELGPAYSSHLDTH